MLPPHPVRPPASTRPLAQPPKQLAISFIRPFRSSLKNTPPRCSILIAALQLASPARPRQLHDTPRYPQISIARQGVAPFSLPLPRFRSLAVFVRRPGVRGTVREGPASENHLTTGLTARYNFFSNFFYGAVASGGENLGFPDGGAASLGEVSHVPPSARDDSIVLHAGTCAS